MLIGTLILAVCSPRAGAAEETASTFDIKLTLNRFPCPWDTCGPSTVASGSFSSISGGPDGVLTSGEPSTRYNEATFCAQGEHTDSGSPYGYNMVPITSGSNGGEINLEFSRSGSIAKVNFAFVPSGGSWIYDTERYIGAAAVTITPGSGYDHINLASVCAAGSTSSWIPVTISLRGTATHVKT